MSLTQETCSGRIGNPRSSDSRRSDVPPLRITRAVGSSEQDLIARVQAGERGAFQEFVERYQAPIFHLLSGLLEDGTEADTIAQQVFVQAYRSIARFKADSSPLGELYQIAIHEAFEEMRKHPHEWSNPKRTLVLRLLTKINEDDRILRAVNDVPALPGPNIRLTAF